MRDVRKKEKLQTPITSTTDDEESTSQNLENLQPIHIMQGIVKNVSQEEMLQQIEQMHSEVQMLEKNIAVS